MFTIRLFIYPGHTLVITCFITISFSSPVTNRSPHVPCEEICQIRRRDANCESRGLTHVLLTGCHEVRSLNLAHNELRHLSADILPEFPGTVKMDFSNNPITSLEPGSFGNNLQLEEIFLNRIRITRMSNETFVGLSLLRKLHFWAGKLEVLEERSLAGLSALTEVDLSLNRIHSLPQRFFDDNVYLEIIAMSVNKLTELPSDIFSNLAYLREIELASNKLTTIPENLFAGLHALEKVDLRRNLLVQVPAINVKYLDLSFNEISSLPLPANEEEDGGGVRWEDVRLHRNPLSCDYTIEPLRRWYACQMNKSCNGTASVDRWVCGSPAVFNGERVDHLPSLATTTLPPTTSMETKSRQTRKMEEFKGNQLNYNHFAVDNLSSGSCMVIGSAVLTTLLATICHFTI